MAQVRVVLKSVWDDKAIKQAKKEFSDLGKSIGVAFAAVGVAAAAGTAAITKFSLDAIKAASLLDTEFEGVNQVFGRTAASVQAFAKTASRSVGLSEAAALGAAKNFGVFATSAGLGGEEASNFAIQLVKAAGDLASFNDVPIGETLDAIRSGLRGQTEPLTKFGILMSDTALRNKALELGIISNTKNALTPQQKVLASNALILEQLGAAQGDFVKYQDVFGNRLASVTAEFQNLQAAIGLELMPAASEFLGVILDLTPVLGDALVPVAENFGEILTKQVVPAIKDFTNWLASPQGIKTLKDLTQGIVDAIKAFIDFVGWAYKNRDALVALAIAIGSVVVVTKVATTVTALYNAALVLFKTQVTTATGATTAFATALKALPWVAAVAGTALFFTSMSQYADAVYGSKVNTEGLTRAEAEHAKKVEGLVNLLQQYNYALQNGNEVSKQLAREGIARVQTQLRLMGQESQVALGHLKELNNIKLDALVAQANRARDAFANFTFTGTGGTLEMLKKLFPSTFTKTTTTTTTGETARERVQKFIKQAQKQLEKAQEQYNKTVARAQKRYAEDVIKTEREFAKRLADIVKESQDRLRSAYAQAVQTNIGSLFEAFKATEEKRKAELETAQEQLIDAQKALQKADAEFQAAIASQRNVYFQSAEQAFGAPLSRAVKVAVFAGKTTAADIQAASTAYDEARREFERLNEIVSKGLNKENPVDVLVNNLRDKLRASRQLLSNSAALASAGFTQTFIEQVVSAGTETGNELAEAILQSTPQVQSELKALFLAIENESEKGMDALARELYIKQGFATNALKELYEQTQRDLNNALIDLRIDLNDSIIEANLILIESVKDIREAFKENIDSMKGDLGGLGKVVDEFYKKLGKTETDAQKRIEQAMKDSQAAAGGSTAGAIDNAMKGMNVLASSVNNATGILIDSADDIRKVLDYLTERIVAANEFAARATNAGQTAQAISAMATRDEFMNQLRSLRAAGTGAVGTIININVKTDSTQSVAMVGKTLGNTITKYVTAGGQVLVSPTN